MIGCNSVLRGNSDLRGVDGHGMSKFDGKPYSLPISSIVCYLFRNSENKESFHFGSCGESFSNLQLRPIFAPNKPNLFSH